MALLKLKRTPKKKMGVVGRIKNKSWGQSRSYLFEYGFMLLLVGILNVLLITMFKAIVAASNSGVDAAAGGYGQSILVLSAVLVVLPLLILLIQRTAASQRINPVIKNTGWRKAFLGIFLATTSIAALVTTIMFVSSLVGPVSTAGLATGEFDWRASLSGFFSAALLTLTAWVFAEDYRYLKNDGSARLRHIYRYGVVSVSLIITVVFVVWPMCEQRKVAVDDAIVGDITAIQAHVIEYEQKNSKVPEELGDLKLDAKVLKRADKYGYTYERSGESGARYTLCAVFKTDATDKIPDFGGMRPLPALLGSAVKSESSIYPDFGGEKNPTQHKAGRDCFDFTAKFDAYPTERGEFGEKFFDEPVLDMPITLPAPAPEQL